MLFIIIFTNISRWNIKENKESLLEINYNLSSILSSNINFFNPSDLIEDDSKISSEDISNNNNNNNDYNLLSDNSLFCKEESEELKEYYENFYK